MIEFWRRDINIDLFIDYNSPEAIEKEISEQNILFMENRSKAFKVTEKKIYCFFSTSGSTSPSFRTFTPSKLMNQRMKSV